MDYKLGKLPPRHDPRTLQLADYLLPVLPPAPPSRRWDHGITAWGMMGNDRIGDCTTAAAGHAIQTWTANASNEVTISDAAVIAAYSAVTGYNPADPTTDRGAVVLDVLNYWRSPFGGHSIGAFVATEPSNHEHVKLAVSLFGGCYIGFEVPDYALHQRVWSVQRGTHPIIGGHAVWVCGYDSRFLYCVSWGQIYRMTWAFWDKFCDESYAILSPDWFKPNAVSPSGFDLVTLTADLQAVTH